MINNIYITCRSSKSYKYIKLKKMLEFNGINIFPWIKERIIPKNKTNNFITNTCNVLCTNDMIIEWICHVTLWQHLYNNNNKYDRVLILDENINIAKGFLKKLDNAWNIVPYNWDIVYLNKKNKLSGYIISLTTIKKLVQSNLFNKIDYNLTSALDNYTKGNLNAIILNKQLIGIKKEVVNNHKLLDPLFIPIFGNVNDAIYNFGNIYITYYLILFIIVSFLMGYKYGNNIYGKLFVTIIVFQQLVEMGYFKITTGKIETLVFELIIILLFYIIGTKVTSN